jgi:anti-sigma factor RsiW
MTASDRPIGEDDLQAFVDERLDDARRKEVEAFLAAHSEVAAKVRAYAGQREQLRARLSFVAVESIPARLRVATITAERQRRLGQRLKIAAAAFGFFLIGGSAGWFANDLAGPRENPGGGSPLVRQAVSAHRTFVVEIVHPTEVKADEEQHLVHWLSKRLGRKLKAPDLTAFGFKLMGGRLLPASETVAAQFMYETAEGRRLTLYIRGGEKGETAFRLVQQDGVGGFFWIDEGFGYAVLGDAERSALLNAAQTIYRQLDLSQSASMPKT